MAIINANSIESLVQTWIKAEEQGEQFPVPFEDAWAVAGYARKDSAKRKLEAFFDEGFDYSTELRIGNRGGKPEHLIWLSCNTFKEFCMVSKTDVGKATRRYFIETAQKWQLVEQHHPAIAESIEERLLDKTIKLEELRAKNNQIACDMATMHGKEYALVAMGKSDQVVETEKPTIEIIDERYNVRFEGQTLVQVKDFVAKKYGIKFKSGAEIKRFLEKKKCGDLIAQTPRSVVSDYVPLENLDTVYKVLCNDSRQLLIGQ